MSTDVKSENKEKDGLEILLNGCTTKDRHLCHSILFIANPPEGRHQTITVLLYWLYYTLWSAKWWQCICDHNSGEK